jgi:hypothetical protein
MSACRDCDESSLASEPGVSIRGSAIAAHGPQPEGVHDLRLAIGVALFALAAARSSLLEMSARLRHTTLGADAATRATVAADFTYAYAWLGATGATPEGPGTPASDGHATPTLAARAAKPAPRH